MNTQYPYRPGGSCRRRLTTTRPAEAGTTSSPTSPQPSCSPMTTGGGQRPRRGHGNNGVPFRVRSGGHALEGWSGLDDGIVIDVSALKSVTIDGAAQTATVGAGLNQMEAVLGLGAAGFAAPTGTEGSVGLAGATLGGGFGLLTRKFGMASDNLLAAEVVIASADGGAEVVTGR